MSSHFVKPFALFLILVAAITFYGPDSASAEELVVVGTGDSQTLLRSLGRAYERTHPDVSVVVPDSIGSNGGIRAVISGKHALGRIARPLTPQEESFGLTSLTFGYSPIAFMVNKSVTGVSGLTSDEVVSIFSGGISSWSELGGPQQKIYLVNREEGDSTRRILASGVPGFAAIEKFPGPIFFSTPEAIDALATHSYTIGYGPVVMLRSEKMRVLNYNAVAPTAENVAKGIYPLWVPLGLVWKGEIPPAYQKFVDFLSSSTAREIMLISGVQPATAQ